MKTIEKNLFYNWATKSDATPFWYGDLYGDTIPSKEKFFNNWKAHYFHDSNPELGRCFVILRTDTLIGQINYNKIDQENSCVEIDILIADSRYWNRGYGSDAIRTFVRYLFEQFKLLLIWIACIKTNPRAIKTYQKAGFVIADQIPSHITIPSKGTTKKEDWIVLIKRKDSLPLQFHL